MKKIPIIYIELRNKSNQEMKMTPDQAIGQQILINGYNFKITGITKSLDGDINGFFVKGAASIRRARF